MSDRPLVFASGSMPQACRNGHPWEPGDGGYWLRWTVCDCPEAMAVSRGHHVAECRTDGCDSPLWRDPPCDYRTAPQ